MKRTKAVFRNAWIEGILIALAFMIGFAIRGYNLSVLIAAPDELTYASRAIHILSANWSWQAPYMWDQPPLLTYLLAVMIAVSGASLDTMRLLSVFAGSLSVVIAYYLGKSMYGRIAGSIAAIAVLFDGYDILYSRQIYIEALATMLILAALLLFWEGVIKRRSLKISVIAGFIFGLALDSKYIALVMAVSLFLFLIYYMNRFKGGFPLKQSFAFFGSGFLTFLPVLVALGINNVNPFYYDLVYRFQLHQSSAVVHSVQSGQLFVKGFTNFVQVFFHVSSSAPFQVFPLLIFDIPVWTILIICVIAFFVVSFFVRKNLADGLLLILFVMFLAFAFTYPDRRTYFSLYPSLILLVMVGRIGQLAVRTIREFAKGKSLLPYIGTAILCLIVLGLAFDIVATPTIYQNGFGDWDQITPVMNYLSTYHGNNTYVATDLAEIGYYIEANNLNFSIAFMKQPQEYYSESPLNQSLQTPTRGVFPIYWVLSVSSIEKVHPQFVILPAIDYKSTTLEFQTFITERYYQPLSTNHILLFEIRPGNQTANWNFTGCC
ncbi:MAG: glycosyltransferase family 39 protein [Nitrososphaerota archaeon]|nr:glycosyltransferase family 39 protein [Nitrososphaerota archaeon]